MVWKIDVCPAGLSRVSFKPEDEGGLPVSRPGIHNLPCALSVVPFKTK